MRLGCEKVVLVTSDWISTSSGLEPSIEAITAEPACSPPRP
ncbi:MAG: hypothetical protein BWY87_01399 [Deltaproteobacteria bacterium ADurb.Bin510]|nr:MAG: hypothetical protein BWY87_01399 [Deltaproteobacteria bacterium ADurb.Bin510]